MASLLKAQPRPSSATLLLDPFAPGNSQLIIARPEGFDAKVLQIFRGFQTDDVACIYLAFARPSRMLLPLPSDIDTEKILFIDCIPESSNAIKLSPENLNDILIVLSDVLAHTHERRAIIIDSVSSLLLYHPPDIVERFLQHLTLKAFRDRFALLVFALPSLDAQLLDALKPHFTTTTNTARPPSHP